MPEVATLQFNPMEQRMQPDTQAADALFTSLYKSLADMTKAAYDASQTPDARQRRAQYKTEEPFEPQVQFVKERFDRVHRFEPFERPTNPDEIADRLIAQAETKAVEVYTEEANKGKIDSSLVGVAVSARVEKSKRVVTGFIDRATQMLKDGETDALTVKSFFGRIEGAKRGDTTRGYNNLVRKKDESRPDEQIRDRYRGMVNTIFAGKTDIQDQEDGSFKHVNARHAHKSKLHTKDRYYISPLLNGQPDQVLKIWVDTLTDLGLDERLYYKVGAGLGSRYDTIIAYTSSETEADMQNVIVEFTRRCPKELLSDSTLPSGVEVAKGIARAFEPAELNKLLDYCGIDSGGNSEVRLSYNGFVVGLAELSLQRAAYDFKKQGREHHSLTPKDLSDKAKTFFAQYLKLSGINPATLSQLPSPQMT